MTRTKGNGRVFGFQATSLEHPNGALCTSAAQALDQVIDKAAHPCRRVRATHEHHMNLLAVARIEGFQQRHQLAGFNGIFNRLGAHPRDPDTFCGQLALGIAIVGFDAAFDRQ